jgi:hypothetical protein
LTRGKRIVRLMKAERFIQTLLREWPYAFVYPSSGHRSHDLQPWTYHYNAIGHTPQRLIALPSLASDSTGATC